MTNPVQLLEALLFVRADPVSVEQIGFWLNLEPSHVDRVVDQLSQALSARESALMVRVVSGGVQLATRPEYHAELSERLALRPPEPLSHASWEVLSIVAYRQPITRMEIEAIRQTGSERALQTLGERRLIEEVGRKEVPGRPILYGTTPIFLQEFGLAGLDELPPLSDAVTGPE